MASRTRLRPCSWYAWRGPIFLSRAAAATYPVSVTVDHDMPWRRADSILPRRTGLLGRPAVASYSSRPVLGYKLLAQFQQQGVEPVEAQVHAVAGQPERMLVAIVPSAIRSTPRTWPRSRSSSQAMS